MAEQNSDEKDQVAEAADGEAVEESSSYRSEGSSAAFDSSDDVDDDDPDAEVIKSARGSAEDESEEDAEAAKEDEEDLKSSSYWERKIHRNAKRSGETLRSALEGSVLVNFRGEKSFLSVEWSEEELPTVGEGGKGDKAPSSDCKIEMSEEDLKLIARGSLNPQIAMLSHKIKVTGKAALAVPFFNLIFERRR